MSTEALVVPRMPRVLAAWIGAAIIVIMTSAVFWWLAIISYGFSTWGGAPTIDGVVMFWGFIVTGAALAMVLIPTVWSTATKTPASWAVGLVPPATFCALYGLGVLWGRWEGGNSPENVVFFLIVFGLAAGATVLFFARDPRLAILGIVVIGVAISCIAAAPSSAVRAAEAEQAFEVDTIAQEAAARATASEAYLDAGSFPLTSDATGWHATSVVITPRAQITTLADAGGATAELTVFDAAQVSATVADSEAACTFVQQPGDAPLSVDNPRPSWCTEANGLWSHTSAIAVASLLPDGRFAVVSAEKASDTEAVWAGLRPLTRAEVDHAIVPAWADQNTAPDIVINDPKL